MTLRDLWLIWFHAKEAIAGVGHSGRPVVFVQRSKDGARCNGSDTIMAVSVGHFD